MRMVARTWTRRDVREMCTYMGMVFLAGNKVALCLNNSDGCASFLIYRNSHI